jgi:hypothetical protein
MTKNKQVHGSCFHFSLLSKAVFHYEGVMNGVTFIEVWTRAALRDRDGRLRDRVRREEERWAPDRE